jgi:hypothetical protein
MNYTKGEWEISGDKALNCADISITIIQEHGVKVIARIEKTWDNPEANAHLIAAAPDCYEALKEIEAWYEAHAGSLPTKAKEALAKAEGAK